MPIAPLDPEVAYGSGGSIDVTNWVAQDLPNGIVDGVNTIFTLTFTPVSNSLILRKNGVTQIRGMDYNLSGNSITMTAAPILTDNLHASYFK